VSAVLKRASDIFQTLSVIEETEADACTNFRKYDLPRLSFTDCTSFALVNAHHIDHVFSFDEHFRMFRYNHPVTLLGAAE
jgi:predicted nucleic acid-binding protein